MGMPFRHTVTAIRYAPGNGEIAALVLWEVWERLLDGHDVSQCLEWVVLVRQRIDHRRLAVFGELLEAQVIEKKRNYRPMSRESHLNIVMREYAGQGDVA